MDDYHFKKGDIAHSDGLGEFVVQHQNYDGYVFKDNKNYCPKEKVNLIISAEEIQKWKNKNELP